MLPRNNAPGINLQSFPCHSGTLVEVGSYGAVVPRQGGH